MDERTNQDQDPWISVGNWTGWAWERAFTKPGAVTFCCLASVASLIFAEQAERWWAAIVYFPLALIGLGFLLLLVVFTAIFGDFVAEWAIGKVFKSPNPKNSFHRAAYLFLSAIGFVVMAFILGLGDPIDRGYWHP